MLGRYQNFPGIYHGIVRFHHPAPANKLQEMILQALHKLSRERGFDFPSIHAVSNCKVSFDFGIADGLTFNYLNKAVLKASLKNMSGNALLMLDFLCVVRYYRKDGGARRPLRFDYYFLRFLFDGENVEFRIYHERGTRRLPIEDLSTIIINRVDGQLSESRLPKITVEHARTL